MKKNKKRKIILNIKFVVNKKIKNGIRKIITIKKLKYLINKEKLQRKHMIKQTETKEIIILQNIYPIKKANVWKQVMP